MVLENVFVLRVKAFHEKHGFPIDQPMESTDHPVVGVAADRVNLLANACMADLEANPSDVRLQRAQLMLEELGETLDAINCGDVVALADGLADLIYVAVGTAVAHGIPVDHVFSEVHQSNLTKDVGDQHKPMKGDDWVEPDVDGVLTGHWKRDMWFVVILEDDRVIQLPVVSMLIRPTGDLVQVKSATISQAEMNGIKTVEIRNRDRVIAKIEHQDRDKLEEGLQLATELEVRDVLCCG